MTSPFEIRYNESAANDLLHLRAYDRKKVVEGIERHLAHQPKFLSKSRIKQMRQPFWSQFRLRLEDFRVYYDVDDAAHAVQVLRVLQKTNDPTPEGSP